MTASQTPSCCCPRCGATELLCDECCHCVPEALCFRLVDAYGADVANARGTIDTATGIYSVTLSCNTVSGSADITVTLEKNQSGTCVWHVEAYSLGIDEEYTIGTAYGEETCISPDITITDVTIGNCTGDLRITAEQFVAPDYATLASGCADYFCSMCKCFCERVCFAGETYTWDAYTEQWDHDDAVLDPITITRESTGACTITVPGYDPVTLGETFSDCDNWAIQFTDVSYNTEDLTCWKCKCGEECIAKCVSIGESHSPCTVAETALFYVLSGLGELDAAACCDENGPILERDALECKWCLDVDCGSGPASGTWCLEIVSSTEATITLTKGADVWTWESMTGYDPLCTSEFELTSSPSGQTCDVFNRICATPANGCCDTDTRATGLPATLNVDGEHCCDGATPTPFSFTITWNTSTDRWEGSTTICGTETLTLWIRCVCGIRTDCGSDGGGECYESKITFDGCGTPEDTGWVPVTASTDCTCDPFELTLQPASILTNCCAAVDLIDLDLVVTE